MTTYPFHDTTDFEDADRGLIGSLVPGVVKAADGRVVWDNDAYAFLDADCPDTANPSLWRQSQLCAKQGLYEVTDGIYQVRGLDLSNMTLVESDNGVIVIDPLISKETAAAALGALPRAPRRPAGHGRHLHPRPRRPLRRGARRLPRRHPDRGRARLHGLGRLRERLRRRRHEPAGRVHVRRQAAEGPGRPDRRRARPDHLGRHRRGDPADARDHPHRARRRRSTACSSASR